MNGFLKSRTEINLSTANLKSQGLTSHPIQCKDWELWLITSRLRGNDLLDMGADGSFILHNAIQLGSSGRKVGIDLAEVTGTNKADGAEYVVGDLMATPFPDNSFDMITCQSVIEHSVNFEKFAAECSRLLRHGGELFVSFDFWDPKPDTSKTKLYSLDWNILDKQDVLNLVLAMDRVGLSITSEIDWSVGQPVITPSYCSPAAGVEYTFGILSFVKTI